MTGGAGAAASGSDPPDPGRLHRLLGGAELAWLVERVRGRMARGRPLSGMVTLTRPTAEQRRAAERLLGRRAGAGGSLSVPLEEVDRVLRDSGTIDGGLGAAVVALRGPVADLVADRARRAAAWQAAHAGLDAAVADRPELAGWRSWLDTTGVVRRLAPEVDQAGPLLDALAAVLRDLPAPGVPIGRLAARTCGDAHALDQGRPLGTLALSAARALLGLPYGGGGAAETAGRGAAGGGAGRGGAAGGSRREVWAGVGVHLDELSSTVLCLGLTGDAATPLGRMLGAAADAGEPCALTLRQLRRHTGTVGAGLVRLCENPVVVAAAAEELGPGVAPLVCVNGRPSDAVWALLDLLAGCGASFAYHGDFDWPGIAIAAAVYERVGWRPWRYDAAGYAAGRAGLRPPGGPGGPAGVAGSGRAARTRLAGRPHPTPWDPALAGAMSAHGVRVEEELVLDDLLADLA